MAFSEHKTSGAFHDFSDASDATRVAGAESNEQQLGKHYSGDSTS